MSMFSMDYNHGGGSMGPSSPPDGSGGGRPRRNYGEQTMIPVTIGMILRSSSTSNMEGTGALALPDGREVSHVKFVGAVRTVEVSSTNVKYEVEDGSGLVEVKQWIDDNDCEGVAEMRLQAAQENVYVKVVGQIREYEGKKGVLGNSVRRLDTGNELTHHLLEAVYSAENYKKKNSIVSTGQPPMGSSSFAPQQSYGNDSSFAPHRPSSSMGQPLGAREHGGGGGGGGLQNDVLEFIRREGAHYEEGVNIEKIIHAMNYDANDIRRCLENLATDGQVYSTINEHHFQFSGPEQE